MALDDLAERLAGVNIAEGESLPFRPPHPDSLPYMGQTGDRYLYRISDYRSDGITNAYWAKSADAFREAPSSRLDSFAKSASVVSKMLHRHLKWEANNPSDNFVSWTSSLLFALRYAVYRSAKHGTSLNDIKLCVVDTTKFPDGTFFRDLDLIAAFAGSYDQLAHFEGLRRKKHRQYSGFYYFGEYLSQGRLSLHNRCGIVSMNDIVDAGLNVLRPDMPIPQLELSWANDVIRLRECWYTYSSNGTTPPGTSGEEIDAASEIATLFDPPYFAPMVLGLLALRPRKDTVDSIRFDFTDEVNREIVTQSLAPLNVRIIDDDNLPEVQQFRKLVDMVYTRCCMEQASLGISDVKRKLQSITHRFGAAQLPVVGRSTDFDSDMAALTANLEAIKELTDNMLQLCNDRGRQTADQGSPGRDEAKQQSEWPSCCGCRVSNGLFRLQGLFKDAA